MPLPKLPDPDDGWSTGAAEVAEKANDLLGDSLKGEEPEPEVKESVETPPPKGQQEPEPEKGEEADRPGGEQSSQSTPDPMDKVYEIDGERYTADEIRDWKLGSMRQDDYTRKTQGLADQRRNENEMVQGLMQQNKDMMALLQQSNRPSEEEVTPEEEVPAGVGRALHEIQERQERQEKWLQDREASIDEANRNDFISSTFDEVTGDLFKKHGIPEDQHRLYERALLGSGLDAEDAATGELTRDSIAQNVRREFLKLHSRAQSEVDNKVQEKLDSFKRTPPQEPVRVAPQNEEPQYKTPADELRRGKREAWNTDDNTRHFLERLKETGARD